MTPETGYASQAHLNDDEDEDGNEVTESLEHKPRTLHCDNDAERQDSERLKVKPVSTIFTLYLHYITIFYYIYTIYTLYLHYIYTILLYSTIFTLYLHYIYTIFTLYLHYIYTIFTIYSAIFTLYLHYIYTIFCYIYTLVI